MVDAGYPWSLRAFYQAMHFFTADTHFGHAAIVKLCQRPFANVDEMDEALIAAWNARVGPRDLVYHLGDFAYQRVGYYTGRLNGKIILIKGNHDYRHRGIAQHFQDVRDATLLKYQGKEIYLHHYACRVWPKRHYDKWHFFGHSHSMLKPMYIYQNSLDVGVDLHPQYAPFSWEEIVERMDKQVFVDPLSEFQMMAALLNDKIEFLAELCKDKGADAACLRDAIRQVKETKDHWICDPLERNQAFHNTKALYSIGSKGHVQDVTSPFQALRRAPKAVGGD